MWEEAGGKAPTSIVLGQEKARDCGGQHVEKAAEGGESSEKGSERASV